MQMLRLSNFATVALVSMAAFTAAQASAAPNLISNGSFSNTHPFDPTNPYPGNPPQPDDWVVVNSDSAQTAGGDWFQNAAFVAPSSDYGAYSVPSNPVLAVYNLGGASQSFGVSSTGSFTLAWQDAAPLATNLYGKYMVSGPEVSGLSYDVLLDGTAVLHIDTAIGQQFTDRALTFNLAAGVHTLAFAGLNVGETVMFGGSNQYAVQTRVFIALLDNVSISAVPDISSASASLLGLLAIFVTSLVRRRSAG